MKDTTRELGGALGVAVLGSILTSQYGSGGQPTLVGVRTQPRPPRNFAGGRDRRGR